MASAPAAPSPPPAGDGEAPRKVLIVYAHPEPRSLNAALRDAATEALEAAGHSVMVSDLYALQWKAAVDRSDYQHLDAGHRLRPVWDSRDATRGAGLTADVTAEQAKLRACDAVIFQFPLWWYQMPAIMKGWIDRVFTMGFAYGLGDKSGGRYGGNRYGNGPMRGKRALLSVTVAGWPEHYSDRGICGPIEDLLFPITHGMLHYTGFDVLDPHIVFDSESVPDERFASLTDAWNARLSTLFTAPTVPFRNQNDGDYELPSLRLKHGLEPDGETGFALHQLRPTPDVPDARTRASTAAAASRFAPNRVRPRAVNAPPAASPSRLGCDPREPRSSSGPKNDADGPPGPRATHGASNRRMVAAPATPFGSSPHSALYRRTASAVDGFHAPVTALCGSSPSAATETASTADA